MSSLQRLLHLRPNETRRVLWVAAIGLCYAAATSLGENIAESVLFSRIDWASMPLVIVLKAAMDVVAALLYLPLTRRRQPGRVWRVALVLYMVTVAATGLLARGDSGWSAYALYVGHECTWTILTIHWGVFILDAFDASQARRLFPLLFTTARVGNIFAGVLLTSLAQPVGALNVLVVVLGLAVAAAVLSLGVPRSNETHPGQSASLSAADHDQTAPETDADPGDDDDVWSRWRIATRSPLVRAIALSTAAMVMVRWGLYVTSLTEIRRSFAANADDMAAFLGVYRALANVAGIVLGLLVAPQLLYRLGVGFANLAYAASTALAFGVMLMFPSLGAAVLARFSHTELKTAIKTPLSTLFYGAEVPAQRAPARALIFGSVIPAAALVSAGLLALTGTDHDAIVATAAAGLGVSVLFFAACAVQNHRWRRRMAQLLSWKLDRAEPVDARAAQEQLAPYRDEANGERLDAIARGLASDEPRLRALAEELLAETIPRAEAHRIAQRLLTLGR